MHLRREPAPTRGSQNLGLAYFGFLRNRVDISMLFRLSETQVSLSWWRDREREREREKERETLLLWLCRRKP